MKATVIVRLKKGVTDPEGANVQKTLDLLGIDGIESVKFSKMFEFELETTDRAEANKLLKESCDRLLSNPVVNDYDIVIE